MPWIVGYPEVIHFIRSSGCPETRLLRSSRGPLAAILPLFPRRLQLPIPLGENLLLMSAEHVPRRDLSDGAVQTDVVVMVYVTLNQTPRVLKRQRRSGTDAFPFE
jgi:hypothetical protein